MDIRLEAFLRLFRSSPHVCRKHSELSGHLLLTTSCFNYEVLIINCQVSSGSREVKMSKRAV